MTIKEFYTATGGNYDDVIGRLRAESLVQKFVRKFPADGSYRLLCDSVAAGDYAEVFRAAHTLKGVCQNLGFASLYGVAGELTELVRDCQPHDCTELLEKITERYEAIIEAIGQLDA